MADLHGLAEMISSSLPHLPGFVGEVFIEPRLTEDDSQVTGPAFRVLHERTRSDGAQGRTRLLFIRGRAGDGKSALLMTVSANTARSVLRGEVDALYLYVNAQGSALARIDEVMAKVLQDLRARFTYHAIATLTRLRLIVPIIDGFDELLGVGGYKDAFSSLALFVSRLSGEGVVLASARSTFYQFTNFGEQAARFATDDNPLLFELLPFTLQPWGTDEWAEFLKKKKSDLSIGDLKRQLGARAEEILSSPFLFSQLVDLRIDVRNNATSSNVVRLIVEELVRREMRDKLLDPQGRPLLTLEQHVDFLGMIAEEMWWQETRELDEQTFTTISELVVEEMGFSGDVAARFMSRVPSYALLARTESPTRISFRHEFYFAYFLGARLAKQLTKGTEITSFLTRSMLSTVVAEEVALSVVSTSGSDIGACITNIGKVQPPVASAETARINAGTLYWAFIAGPQSKIPKVTMRQAYFNGLDFSGTMLKGVEFDDCVFNQCDLTDASWSDLTFNNSTLVHVLVTERTKLQGKGLKLRGGIQGLDFRLPNGEVREFYAQAEVATILERLGIQFQEKIPKPREISKKAETLRSQLKTLLRVPERTLYFSENDFENRGVSISGNLKEIWALLRKHGLLVDASRDHRGQKRMYRLAETPDVIRQGQSGTNVTPSVEAFWADVLNA